MFAQEPAKDPTTFLHNMQRLGAVFQLSWLVLLVAGAMVQVGLIAQGAGSA